MKGGWNSNIPLSPCLNLQVKRAIIDRIGAGTICLQDEDLASVLKQGLSLCKGGGGEASSVKEIRSRALAQSTAFSSVPGDDCQLISL